MLGSIGPADLILLLFILLIIGFLYFGFRWSLHRSLKAAYELPFTWYFFYTYIRLPLSILASVVSLLVLRNIDILMVGLAIIGVQVAAFIGLSRFRAWALKLNIVLLLGECYVWYSDLTTKASRGNERLITAAIVLLAWVVPNVIYFEKRRRYFIDPDRSDNTGDEPGATIGRSENEDQD